MGVCECPSRPCRSSRRLFARIAPATAFPSGLQLSINHAQTPKPPIFQVGTSQGKLPRAHTNAPGGRAPGR